MIDEHDNAMRRQARSIPAMVRDFYKDIETQTRYALTTPEIYSLREVILTGSGDSYCAALAARTAFEQLTRLPVLVLEPMDLARYYPLELLAPSPNNPCVIALSNSGRVTRVLEATARARNQGSLTVAITRDAHSPLAASSDKTIVMEIGQAEPAPGVRSYAAMIVTLYLLAIRIGEVRLKYTMDHANIFRTSILHACDGMDETFDDIDKQCFEIARAFSGSTYFEFIGSGTDYATASYGQKKMYEAVGFPATATDSESWFHVDFFNRHHDRTMSVLIADSRNPGNSRNLELATRMNAMGKRLIVVSNEPEPFGPWFPVRVPECEQDWLAPLTQFVPVALIAGYLASLASETYQRGFEGIWAEDSSLPSTTRSAFQTV